MNDDDRLEQRVRDWYRREIAADQPVPEQLRREVAAIARRNPHPARRERGRSLTLLAAAALLATVPAAAAILGGRLVAEPVESAPAVSPSVAVVPSPSPSDSPRPSLRDGPGLVAFIREDARPGGPPRITDIRIWLVRSDGTDLRMLAPSLEVDPFELDWSRDGSAVFVVAGGRLTAVDVATGQATPIDTGCTSPCVGYRDPDVSPDGSRLVVVRSQDGAHPEAPDSVLATVDLETDRATEVAGTFLPGAFAPCGGAGAACVAPYNEAPAWSPDGRRLAFARMAERAVDPDGPAVPWATVRHGDLVVSDADGSNERTLDLGGLSARDPVWSADGARLLFSSHVEDYIANPASGGLVDHLRVRRDVYTVRPDGTDLRRLTTDGFATGATWTADGRVRFVHVPTDEGNMPISAAFWLIDADGGSARQLTTFGTEVWGTFPIIQLEAPAAAWQPEPRP